MHVFVCAVWESNPRVAALLVHIMARPQNPRLSDAAAAADGRRGDRQTDGCRHGTGYRPLQVKTEGFSTTAEKCLKQLQHPRSSACSAGIGRTGCFIATTIGCRQLQLEGAVDVLSITCQLRADR